MRSTTTDLGGRETRLLIRKKTLLYNGFTIMKPSSPTASYTRLHRMIVSGFFLAVLLAFSATSCAEEPADKSAEEKPPAKEGFEGLGFSVAPKEGGKARTSLFGLTGEGYKFVFVIDRSGSMGGDGRNTLRIVKNELVECLKNLDSVHQFQFVFYNHRPVQFNPSGRSGQLAFATDDNKRRAERFLDRISAEGGTNHEDALRLAVRMQPDVIFFLTDADEPVIEPKQMARISAMAAGIVINTVEFGAGPKPEGRSFIAELARQNGGQYAYIDTTKRDAEKTPNATE